MFEAYRSSASNTIFLPTFENIYMHHMMHNLDKENEYTQKMLNLLTRATEQLKSKDLSLDEFNHLVSTIKNSPIKGEAVIYDELVSQGYSFVIKSKEFIELWKIKDPYINMPVGKVW
jgi:hypothetical protein